MIQYILATVKDRKHYTCPNKYHINSKSQHASEIPHTLLTLALTSKANKATLYVYVMAL